MENEEQELGKLGDRKDPEAVEKRKLLNERLKLKKELIQAEAIFSDFSKDEIGYVTKYPDLTANYIKKHLSEEINAIRSKLANIPLNGNKEKGGSNDKQKTI